MAGVLLNDKVIEFDDGVEHTPLIQVDEYVPAVETVIWAVVAPVDHFKVPTEQPLSKTAEAPHIVPFPPPINVTVGAGGVVLT